MTDLVMSQTDGLLRRCRAKSKEPVPLMGKPSMSPYGTVGQSGNGTMDDRIMMMVNAY